MATGRINQIAKQDSSETSTPLAYTIVWTAVDQSSLDHTQRVNQEPIGGVLLKSFIAIDIFQTLADQLPLFFHITD